MSCISWKKAKSLKEARGLKDRFCKACGAKLVKDIEPDGFSKKTGKRKYIVYYMECPIKDKRHNHGFDKYSFRGYDVDGNYWRDGEIVCAP